ncbi:MAG TPA: MauE/DoxX family redox-associated membrane protein [Acidimicrobiales bacterium]
MAEAAQWCRFVLATVFAVAATAKLGDRAAFTTAVAGYRLLPDRWAAPVARLLPPLELAAAVLLVLGVATGPVAAALGALLVAFVVAVAANLATGRRIDCGCFGATVERRLSWWTVGRNLALVAAAAVVVADPPAALSLAPLAGDPGPADRTAEAAAMLAAGSLTVLAALLASGGATVAAAARRVERRA